MARPPAGKAAQATPRQTDLTLLQADLRLAGRLDARFFALLRALRDTGSLRRAAQTAGYSYKGAWLVLEAASAQALTPLFETSTGGRGGGGSRLTPPGDALLAGWDALQRRHQAFLQAQETALLADPAFAGLLRRTAMRTTARNQFAGTVASVEADACDAWVRVAIAGGQVVAATTGAAMVTRLGIVPGREALLMAEAASVSIATADDAQRLSSDNRLVGTVARLDRGPVTVLVVLTLPGGATVTATAPLASIDLLGLRVGQPAAALFEATAVLLAVAA